MRAPVLRGQIDRVGRAQHPIFARRHRLERLKAVRALLPHILVGIHAARNVDDSGRHILRFKNIQRAQNRLLPRAVAVIAHPHLGRIALEQARLLLGERRAQRRHNARNALLAQRHHVHIALDQNQPLQPALLARHVEGVQSLPLVEHRRVRCVEVFGIAVAHDAPAEAQHLALRVDDGKHRAVAEHVVAAAVLLARKAGLLELLERKALPGQMARERVPALRRGAKSEAAYARVVQPAFVQIAQRLRALRRPDRGVIKARRLEIGLVDAFPERAHFVAVAAVADAFGQLHVRPLGQHPDGVHELHALDVHHKIDDRAALMAAEAVIHLRFAVHAEGRRLFPVEGTASPEPAPFLLQLDIIRHHVHNIDAPSQLVQPDVRKPGTHLPPPVL